MNNKNLRKYAFTLAETLVTLAIIGVVMALMLRAVNRVSPNKDKLLFLKSYRAVEQAIEESINDQDKYDQATYTAAKRAAGVNEDFRDAPYSSYESPTCGNNISQQAAVCCFLADNINTIGAVNCSAAGQNFISSNGVCFGGWYPVGNDGSVSGYVQPDCSAGGTQYTITVSHSGKVSVPADSTQAGWMMSQSKLK